MVKVSELSRILNRIFPERIDALNRELHRRATAGTSKPHLWRDIERLLKRGADINAPDKNGEYVLSRICGLGMPEVVKSLVETAGADVSKTSPRGVTPVKMAAWASDAVSIELLLSHGAAPDAKNSKGEDAAFEVIHGGKHNANSVHQGECLTLLQAQGVPISDEDKTFIYQNRVEIARFVPEVAAARELDAAVDNRNLEMINSLIAAGYHPDLPVKFGGLPPLLSAARRGDLKLIELLGKAGADPNLDPPALLEATGWGQRGAIKALLDLGANPEAQWHNGKKLADFARASSDPGMETFLTELFAERAKVWAPDVVLQKKVTTMPKLRFKPPGTFP